MLFWAFWYGFGLAASILIYTFQSYEQGLAEDLGPGEMILMLGVAGLGPLLLIPVVLLLLLLGLFSKMKWRNVYTHGFLLPYMRNRNKTIFLSMDPGIRKHLRADLQ